MPTDEKRLKAVAKRLGLTLKEARELRIEAARQERLDERAYEESSPEEKEAHDNR